jgi:hypothetical protein
MRFPTGHTRETARGIPALGRRLWLVLALFLVAPGFSPVLCCASEACEDLSDEISLVSAELPRQARHKKVAATGACKSVLHLHCSAPSSSHMSCKSWSVLPRGRDTLNVPLRC